jgi:hypothetical protein
MLLIPTLLKNNICQEETEQILSEIDYLLIIHVNAIFDLSLEYYNILAWAKQTVLKNHRVDY